MRFYCYFSGSMFPADGPKQLAVVWLSISRGVCKQSLIAKEEFAGAHVFFWHFGLLKDCCNEKTQCLNPMDIINNLKMVCVLMNLH